MGKRVVKVETVMKKNKSINIKILHPQNNKQKYIAMRENDFESTGMRKENKFLKIKQ